MPLAHRHTTGRDTVSNDDHRQHPTPYYSDESVTLYLGDAAEILANMADRSVDAVITDPPYDERTHSMARSSSVHAPAGGRALSGSKAKFAALTHEHQVETFIELRRVTRRWVVSTLASGTAFRFELDPPTGLRVLRIGVWVKTNPMPIFSGDRPAMGWEPIAYMHRDDVKPTWNGGGCHGNYVLPKSSTGDHPTQKPLPMFRDFVRRFTNPGDTILDPYAGSGTTGRAALDEGRKVILCENREDYCEFIVKRLSQGVLDFGEGA